MIIKRLASRVEAFLIPMRIVTSLASGAVIDPDTVLDDRIWKPDFQPAAMKIAWRWGWGLTLESVTSMMILRLDSTSLRRQFGEVEFPLLVVVSDAWVERGRK